MNKDSNFTALFYCVIFEEPLSVYYLLIHIAMKNILVLLLLIYCTPCAFCQKSGKNDISFGVLTQGDFYLFSGARNYHLYADYRRSYKQWFTRFRVSYHSSTVGSTVFSSDADTSKITYLWIEANKLPNFQFRNRISFTPKSGLKPLESHTITTNEIDVNLWLGYYFKLGAKKQIQIEPSLGFTSYYFRDDVFWLELPLKFGSSTQNPAIPERRTYIFSSTRGIVWGPEADVTFRYYLKKYYSLGANVIGGTNKYFNTFYFGGFIGLNF